MLKLALVGKNISHSKSQQMYEGLLGKQVDYSLLDYGSEEEIPDPQKLFESYQGISITAPYKEHFLPFIEVDNDILELGAVNCLKKENEKIFGTNTDYLALKEILNTYLKKNIIILGDGAMFRVCKKVLGEYQKEFTHFARKKDGPIEEVDLSALENAFIINTCARKYVFNGKVASDSIFYDLNYSFDPHIEKFKKINCRYIDGLELLELQAHYALKYWNLDS